MINIELLSGDAAWRMNGVLWGCCPNQIWNGFLFGYVVRLNLFFFSQLSANWWFMRVSGNSKTMSSYCLKLPKQSLKLSVRKRITMLCYWHVPTYRKCMLFYPRHICGRETLPSKHRSFQHHIGSFIASAASWDIKTGAIASCTVILLQRLLR